MALLVSGRIEANAVRYATRSASALQLFNASTTPYTHPMNIVVLDGHTLNPGDLDWTELQSLGSCQIHDRTAPDQILARAAEAEIILTNKVALDRDLIAALPRLRYIGVLATGYNVVDTAAARARGIPVTNVPDYSTRSVAQLTFALQTTSNISTPNYICS